MTDVTKGDVARGAGVALLSRLGAVIEVVAQPAYTWMFGLPTYGLYTVLWAAVNLVENVVDLAMTSALQRVVPQADDETRAHAALKLALAAAMIPAILAAVAATLAAEPLAALLNVAPRDRPDVVLAVALFAWALPLWTFVEVATSALRARRAFGPEIRLRIVYEQVLRLAFAFGFWLAGVQTLGLIAAHLLSLAVVAALSVRLLGRYYDLALAWRAPFDRVVLHDLLATGFAILPANIVRRAFGDLPPIVLNLMLPGSAGAAAAGLYGIARKVSSLPQLVRIAFGYVMAPLASLQASRDRAGVQPIYAFATRLSTVVVVPVAAALIILGDEFLRLFAPEARAALPLLVLLTAARGLEAVAGPASAVLEMIGHRAWPTINSLVGLALWVGLSLALVPAYGAVGMAAGVAAGTVAAAYLSVGQLWLGDRLNPFARPFARALLASLAAVAAISAVAWAVFPLPEAVGAPLVLIALVVALWLAMRFGLPRDDRAALGGIGRLLGT